MQSYLEHFKVEKKKTKNLNPSLKMSEIPAERQRRLHEQRQMPHLIKTLEYVCQR